MEEVGGWGVFQPIDSGRAPQTFPHSMWHVASNTFPHCTSAHMHNLDTSTLQCSVIIYTETFGIITIVI